MGKCYICEKGRLKKEKKTYKLYGMPVGDFMAETCDRCHETYYDETTSKKITEKAKKLGIYGLEAKTRIGMSGSTLDIRLPKKIIEFMGLRKGEEITIMPEGKNKLIITL